MSAKGEQAVRCGGCGGWVLRGDCSEFDLNGRVLFTCEGCIEGYVAGLRAQGEDERAEHLGWLVCDSLFSASRARLLNPLAVQHFLRPLEVGEQAPGAGGQSKLGRAA